MVSVLKYVRRAFDQLGSLKPAVVERHLARLYGMVLVNLVETFERYLKEAAEACIDTLGAFVLDDRFDGFRVQGSVLTVHFGTDSGTGPVRVLDAAYPEEPFPRTMTLLP